MKGSVRRSFSEAIDTAPPPSWTERRRRFVGPEDRFFHDPRRPQWSSLRPRMPQPFSDRFSHRTLPIGHRRTGSVSGCSWQARALIFLTVVGILHHASNHTEEEAT